MRLKSFVYEFLRMVVVLGMFGQSTQQSSFLAKNIFEKLLWHFHLFVLFHNFNKNVVKVL